jgi:hypothetical protein
VLITERWERRIEDFAALWGIRSLGASNCNRHRDLSSKRRRLHQFSNVAFCEGFRKCRSGRPMSGHRVKADLPKKTHSAGAERAQPRNDAI